MAPRDKKKILLFLVAAQLNDGYNLGTLRCEEAEEKEKIRQKGKDEKSKKTETCKQPPKRWLSILGVLAYSINWRFFCRGPPVEVCAIFL